MKKAILFLLWSGITLSAILGVVSAALNVMLMLSLAFNETANSYAYGFLIGRWSFTLIMVILFYVLKRLVKKCSL
jgi:hypothetical protein